MARQIDDTNSPQDKGVSIGGYLIQRLEEYGIGHVFGIPGDYVLSFYTLLEQSPLETVGCTREDCAGFAADAYARVHGMGALCVTYCVGGLSVCNSIAGAYAEKSPVVMITGSPGQRERDRNPLLHHMVRDFRTQYDVFEKLCCAGTELIDPLTAFSEIDRVLATCARYKRPVYLEIPRDMVHVTPPVAPKYENPATVSDTRALHEAVDETVRRIEAARQPVIILGVEVHRFGLQDEVARLAEAVGNPDGGDDARQGRGRRDPSAVHGPLQRRDRPRGSHQVRRRKRLRVDARHVHDRHQSRHLHGRARHERLHPRHERAAADSASPLPRRDVVGFCADTCRPEAPAEIAAAQSTDRILERAVHAPGRRSGSRSRG